MVPEGIEFALFCMNGLPQIPKCVILESKLKKFYLVLHIFNMMQFSYFGQLVSPAKKQHFCQRINFLNPRDFFPIENSE